MVTGTHFHGQTTSYTYDVIGRRLWKGLNNGADWIGYVHGETGTEETGTDTFFPFILSLP